MTGRLKPSPGRKLPVSQMPAAELSRYRRELVRYLRRCPQDEPRYREQRACLAEVLAEEAARRVINRASDISFLVPPVRL